MIAVKKRGKQRRKSKKEKMDVGDEVVILAEA